MEKDKQITKVVFRKFKDNNEIIALFPKEVFEHNFSVLSYMHIGQHSEADYTHVINQTSPATEEEYEDLKDELENQVGYNLKVLKKASVRF